MLHDENDDDDEEEVQDCIVTSWRTSWPSFSVDGMAAMWLCWSTHQVVVGAAGLDACQQEYRPLEARDTRRSRTAARSESSTSPKNHRPAIESSSSSRWLASSMMVHIDDDLDAM